MKNLIIFFLIGNIIQLSGQNLVPNPGFDSLLDCPSSYYSNTVPSQIYKLAPPWSSANNGTPDIFNACSTVRRLSVPYNGFYSYQEPLSGGSYAGIFVYRENIIENGEYLQAPLIFPLKEKHKYFVRFYVSPINHLPSLGYRMTYFDGMGLLFTDTLLNRINGIITTPSIDNTKGRLIKDTVGWTPISGCYNAKGGEKFLTIGNFRAEKDTKIEFEDVTRSSKFPYFYIDDVSVTEFNPLPDSTILICAGETQKYNAAFLNGTYKWSTGSTDSVITITKSGTYSVEVMIDDCILTDTVVVIVPPDAQNQVPILRGDTSLCDGKKIELSAATIPGQYIWSTNETASKITVSKTNNYTVTVTNRCGTYNDAVDIAFKKCDCNVYVPNAFSPNNDGVNDELQIFWGCDFNYRVKRFQVFNRWGNLVFSSHDTNDIRWNGQINGQTLPIGVYVWFLEYEIELDGQLKNVIVSGNFTVML